MGFNLGSSIGIGKGGGMTPLDVFAPGLTDTAGLLGLGPKVGAPDLQQAELNKDAQDILSDRTANANLDPKEYEKQIANEQNVNTEKAGGMLAGGSVDSAMKDAIQRRQEKQFGSLTGRMKRSDLSDAPATRAGRISQSLGAIRNDALNAVNFAQKMKLAQQNKQFARNNAIATVFRSTGALAGMLVGGYLGGTQGAKMGAAGGSAGGASIGGAVAGPTGDLQYLE